MIRTAFTAIALLLVWVPLINAQSSVQSGFEVASIKRGSAYGPGVPMSAGQDPAGSWLKTPASSAWSCSRFG
jgi:hypothetical protein